ncbi:hypothetical protein CspeluHIS016_0200980 [Cutaneotrichosporon spelunceum]|uniref:AFG1-like ATPase-domain-containing protein n=1 Tax=Cutaneotrichosporon spelunceum TaxID=1672016 RepID=A0AAD3YAN5_9TREE|nr:hypothetical protein CspeluHIS016_0200980 [Cutaneotrichosporon spelunceum]
MLRHATRLAVRAAVTAPRPLVARCVPWVRSAPVARRLYSSSKPAETVVPPSETETQKTDLLEVYRGLVESGRLTWDDEQVRIVMRLRHLYNELQDYAPPLELLAKLGPAPPRKLEQSWFRTKVRRARQAASIGLGNSAEEHALVKVLSGEEEIALLTTPKGILITGPPGSGKSFLLNLLFDALPTPNKARYHYHAFTLWLYQRVFAEMLRRKRDAPVTQAELNRALAGMSGWRAVFASGRWKEGDDVDLAMTEASYSDPRDTIPFVIAKDMILQYHILYFDELQLLDASSAALLRDVLSWYWRLGGVVISCSNRVPDDLYHHGVQKDRMHSFLDSLKGRCDVVELDGGRDWRQTAADGELEPRWLDMNDAAFDTMWAAETGDTTPADLVVYGRRVHVPETKGKACRFPFAELCETPLGPADYLTLASTYSTFYIDQVPILLLKHKNEARRLINLIDALYEARCKVVIRAETSPEHLFFPDALDPTIDPEHYDLLEAEALSEALGAQPRANVSYYNPKTRAERERQDLADLGSSFAVTSIFTGEDERFAYKRAVSRLVEMSTSPAYAAEAWNPLGAAARGWEHTHLDAEATAPATRASASPHRGKEGPGLKGDDLATESGSRFGLEFEEPEFGIRRRPPKMAEHHAWGMEERWGAKAGRWGKGSSVYRKENK